VVGGGEPRVAGSDKHRAGRDKRGEADVAGQDFEVKAGVTREVTWSVGGVGWALHGHRVAGIPRVNVVREGRIVAEISVEEARALAAATGHLLGQATPAPTPPPARADRPPMQGRPWTAPDDEALVVAWTAGETLSALTGRFERTRGAITARIARLGLAPHREAVRHEDQRRRLAAGLPPSPDGEEDGG
jgi:hypothetical protein